MLKVRHERNIPSIIGDFKMKRLEFPIIKTPFTKSKMLSMDEYLKFVQFNLKHAFDKKAYAMWKKMLIVDEPFVIK